MSAIAIQIEGLSKQYQIVPGQVGQRRRTYQSLRDAITELMAARIHTLQTYWQGKSIPLSVPTEPFWALQDLSLTIQQGEVIGIIGHNGAGKSTLLKILARITEPTTGTVTIRGRIGSLLEVGTGFHPELTGTENIYLNGAILGMKKAEINHQFDEIVAFAEIERFLQTPVKHYSSGMYMRLAFAVAAHLNPEILLVDEVLAVGDAQFQKKCLGKMEDVAKDGRTVLFVSHNLAAMRLLCHRGILLNQGKLQNTGPIADCINAYTTDINQRRGTILAHLTACSQAIALRTISVNGTSDDTLYLPRDCRTLHIEITGVIARELRMDLEIFIADMEGNRLAFFGRARAQGQCEHYAPGPFTLHRHIVLPPMMHGNYFLLLQLIHPDQIIWAKIYNAVRITAEGFTSVTGQQYEYNLSRRGWIVLDEIR